MKRALLTFAIAGAVATASASELSAQAPRIGDDFGSARIHVGALAPTSTFTDNIFGESSFATGTAVGASVLVWPWQGRIGFGANLFRSSTDGQAEVEWAPMALNDPTQWLFSSGLAYRLPYDTWYPYVAAGVGMKQYNWKLSRHKEDRFFLWDVAAGAEARPSFLGRFGFSAEVRSMHSKLIAFGIDDGTWKPGTPAQPLYPNIGFYGGVVGGQNNHDLMITAAFTIPF
jgi:hypothetical protein